ncbi:hypothetical protein, partial [uncultured Duncaniella sp.]|uniref:hypothetical protein n=1 Tax=uncultured Duncaniella sp. TaxID=2768039 RepID=UPI0026704F5B
INCPTISYLEVQSTSGTTHSESKMKKSSENHCFSELFFFVHHGKIRQNEAYRVGLNIGL